MITIDKLFEGFFESANLFETPHPNKTDRRH